MKRYTSLSLALGLMIAMVPAKLMAQGLFDRSHYDYPAFTPADCDRYLEQFNQVKRTSQSQSPQDVAQKFYVVGKRLEECQQFEAAIMAYRSGKALDSRRDSYNHGIARILVKQQNLDAALELYRRSFQEDVPNQDVPESQQEAQVYHQMGIILAQEGQFRQAQSFFEQAIQLDSKFLQSYQRLGAVFVKQNQFDAAVKTFQTQLKRQFPNQPAHQQLAQARFWVALALENQDNESMAKDWFLKAIESDPTHENSYRKLSKLQAKDKDYQQAIATLEKLLAVSSSDASIFHQIGLVYIEQGDYPKAIAALEQSFPPETRQHIQNPDFNIQLILGSQLMARARYADAVKAFEAASQYDPSNIEARSEQGRALMKLHQWEKALKVHQQIITLLKTRPTVQYVTLEDRLPYLQAEILAKLNRVEEAKAILKPLLDQRADDSTLYIALGHLATQEGKITESLRFFQTAMEKGGADWVYEGRFATPEAMAYAAQGKAFRQLDQHQAAISAFQKAIALDPNFALAYRDLGASLRAQNQYDDSVDAYQKAIQLMPRSGQLTNELFSGLGLTFLAQNEMDQATKAFEQALTSLEVIVEAQYGLGQVHLKQGNLEGAIAAFEKVLEIEPHHDAAQKHLQEAKQQLAS